MRVPVLLMLAGGLMACTEPEAPPAATTEFITQQRAWLPGERDSLVARALRTGQFDFLWLSLSDDIDAILPLDSVWEIVPNPDWAGPVASMFRPVYNQRGTRVPGTGWTTFGMDIHTVNTQQSNDTYDFLGAMWANNADSTWKGLVLAAAAGTTVGATTVNTTAFDAANQKTGAGAGEAKVTGGTTIWLANGTGSPNQFSVGFSFGLGGTTTVTSGPYLGGTRRTLLMNININNVGMTRSFGTQAPATQTASLSGWMVGVQYSCIFPTPCTTNVPGLAAAARRGPLPDSLRALLPFGLR